MSMTVGILTGPAKVVTSKWQLDQADLDRLAALVGEAAIKSTEIIVTKSYDDEMRRAIKLRLGACP